MDQTRLSVNQTLTKIVKSIYWRNTGGDILQQYNPGWWIFSDIDTSKEPFIEKHLKTSHAEIHWGGRFITHFNCGHPQSGVGGLIMCSLHFYTEGVVGKGMSWFLIAAPVTTLVDGKSLYEWFTSIHGKATIEPEKGQGVNKSMDA